MSETGDGNDIVNELLVECYEGLDQLDLDLVELEQCGGNAELIGRVFRCIHTVNGTCGFLGFGALERVAHVGENLLAKVRDGSIGISPPLTSALLRLNDAIRGMLVYIEAHGSEGEVDHSDLIATLVELTEADVARDVRDRAVTCSKQVTIQMEGAGTELDKTIIEAIKDPLTHIVRNSPVAARLSRKWPGQHRDHR